MFGLLTDYTRIPVVIVLILMALCGIYAAFISALSALSPDEEDDLDPGIGKMKDKPDKLIGSAVIVFLIMNGGFSIFIFLPLLFRSLQDINTKISNPELFWLIILIWLAVLVLEAAIVVLFPFMLGRAFHLSVLRTLYKFCNISTVIFAPLAVPANAFAALLTGIFGGGRKKDDVNVTEDEILAIVNEGQESGAIEESEAKMINNIFELSNTEACEIMVPRNNISAFDDSVKIKDALKDILNSSFSRYPVYHEDLDHIVGILHIKDAIRLIEQNPKLNPKLADIKDSLHAPEFVPETKNIDDLFREMQSSNIQMVIVTDEYGQTSGLIAMEDILEEIVGSIRDEYDKESEMITSAGESYEIDGLTRLDDLTEKFGIDFGESDFETINGFITDRMGHIPEDGEDFETDIDGYHFKVLKTGEKMIRLLDVSKIG